MSDSQISTTHKTVNGIDVSRLHDSIEMLKQNPELGRFQFRAHNKWIDGGHVQNVIYDFYGAGQEMKHTKKFESHGDEPEVLLGSDLGPNATESLLAALASCLNASLMYHAAARNIEVEALEMEMEGNIDLQGFLGTNPNVRNGFQDIQVKCKIKADGSDEQIAELCQMAQKYSPVFDTVSRGTTVNVTPERITEPGKPSPQSI